MPWRPARRRDLLKFGGMGLLAASADAVWPLKMARRRIQSRIRAAPPATCSSTKSPAPSATWNRSTSRKTPARPKISTSAASTTTSQLSHLLFPRMEKHIDKLAILRSMLSHEEVHFRGQYYTQTGRQLNLAFAREIPSIGSVIAMELEPRRRPNDTFPIYMSFNLDKAFPGALSTGFLPPRFSVVDINPGCRRQRHGAR